MARPEQLPAHGKQKLAVSWMRMQMWLMSTDEAQAANSHALTHQTHRPRASVAAHVSR